MKIRTSSRIYKIVDNFDGTDLKDGYSFLQSFLASFFVYCVLFPVFIGVTFTFVGFIPFIIMDPEVKVGHPLPEGRSLISMTACGGIIIGGIGVVIWSVRRAVIFISRHIEIVDE